MKPMLGLLDGVLLPELQTWAGQYQCGQASTRHMPIDDLARLVHSHNSLSVGGGGGCVCCYIDNLISKCCYFHGCWKTGYCY